MQVWHYGELDIFFENDYKKNSDNTCDILVITPEGDFKTIYNIDKKDDNIKSYKSRYEIPFKNSYMTKTIFDIGYMYNENIIVGYRLPNQLLDNFSEEIYNIIKLKYYDNGLPYSYHSFGIYDMFNGDKELISEIEELGNFKYIKWNCDVISINQDTILVFNNDNPVLFIKDNNLGKFISCELLLNDIENRGVLFRNVDNTSLYYYLQYNINSKYEFKELK